MTIRQAQPADEAGIVSLETAFPAGQRWSGGLWAEELRAADRCVVVADSGGAITGAATFQSVGDVADLHRIVVASGHRRRGQAEAMLSAGISWARMLGATRMLLEVRADNDAAVALYEGRGFGRIALRSDYYGTGLDALVFELELEKGQS